MEIVTFPPKPVSHKHNKKHKNLFCLTISLQYSVASPTSGDAVVNTRGVTQAT